MAILKASEKLKILALGKATLKEINELEKEAEKEGESNEVPPAKDDKKPESKEGKQNESNEDGKSKEDSKESNETEHVTDEPDEKDKRIAELEKQLKEVQDTNIHGDNSGSTVDTETALMDIFKTFR